MTAYVNIINLFGKKLKDCSQTNLLKLFCITNVTVRLKAVENDQLPVATHLSDFKELFPEDQLLSEKE